MSSTEDRKRIAIIIPQNRTRNWHSKVISTLAQTYDIDIFSDARAPRYPLALRMWMSFERRMFGANAMTDRAEISAKPWERADKAGYLFALNLSEVKLNGLDCPVLEPRFGEQPDSLQLFASILARKNPYLSIHLGGQDRPIVASYPALPDKIVLARGLQLSFGRLVALTERAVRHLTGGGHAAMLPEAVDSPQSYSNLGLALFVVRFALDKSFGRLFRKFRIPETWFTALLWADRWSIPDGPQLRNYQVLADDGRRFYADPFLFTNNGQKWLFVEELDYKTGKGIISCAKVNDDGVREPPRRVLERNYHLSYPNVFRHADEIYMIPETADNRSLELYRAKSFPFEWELHRTLLEDIALYDATLLQHKGRWWIFAAIAHEGGSAFDELAIFQSESLEGPWQPHPLNPVKSDCRSARPAGHIISDGHRILRPAQDCEYGYGDALVWLEIDELSLQTFNERKIARWSGLGAIHADGLHTFNHDGELAVIDIRHSIWKRPFATRQ